MFPGKGIPLFEIPIYLMDEKDYQAKWAEKHYKYASTNAHGDSVLKWLKSFFRVRGISRRSNSHKSIWKYNQIVGYIVVALCNQDIEFNVYLPTDGIKIKKKINFNRRSMLYFESVYSTGNHFNYKMCRSELEIKEKIRKYVNGKIIEHAEAPRYVDLSAFERTLESTNLNKLIQSCIEQATDNDSHNQVRLDEYISNVLNITLVESQQLIVEEEVSFLYSDLQNNDIVMTDILERRLSNSNEYLSQGDIIYIKDRCGIILKKFNKSGEYEVEIFFEEDGRSTKE